MYLKQNSFNKETLKVIVNKIIFVFSTLFSDFNEFCHSPNSRSVNSNALVIFKAAMKDFNNAMDWILRRCVTWASTTKYTKTRLKLNHCQFVLCWVFVNLTRGVDKTVQMMSY